MKYAEFEHFRHFQQNSYQILDYSCFPGTLVYVGSPFFMLVSRLTPAIIITYVYLSGHIVLEHK